MQKADPDLVDPGVTAQLECLLDDVVLGKQGMLDAIDAVCNVALRMIGKLKEGGAAGGPSLPVRAAVGNAEARPPTPAMKRFVVSLARQKGIKPPPGYTKSGAICRSFFDQHAPKKTGGETAGPKETPATNTAKQRRKTTGMPQRSTESEAAAPVKKRRKREPKAAAESPPAQKNTETDTPLRIPYGNKEIAMKLGARYRPGRMVRPAWNRSCRLRRARLAVVALPSRTSDNYR